MGGEAAGWPNKVVYLREGIAKLHSGANPRRDHRICAAKRVLQFPQESLPRTCLKRAKRCNDFKASGIASVFLSLLNLNDKTL